MQTDCHDVEKLTQLLLKSYFQERDYETVISLLDEQITWVGTGREELCLTYEDALESFEIEKEIYQGRFELSQEWYYVTPLDENKMISIALVHVKTPEHEKYIVDANLRFSVIWKRVDGLWKIIHLHNSVPDETMGETTYFNLDLAESTYNIVSNRVQKLTQIDQLTNINNKAGFICKMKEILEVNSHQQYALIKFDISSFHNINYQFGFAFGDQILVNVAKNISQLCHDQETCGYLGKSQFVMLLQYEDKVYMNQRMEFMKTKLIDHDLLKQLENEVVFLAGIYVIQDRNEDIRRMFEKAYIAQHSIENKNCYSHFVYFEEYMLERFNQKNMFYENVSQALKNDEFELYIQPQFQLENCQPVSGEVLCRWITKDQKIIMPNDFIPFLEESELILEFDFYILRKLCIQIKKWMEQKINIVPLSINQSRLHIYDPYYVQHFCDIVDEYQIPHEYIRVEFTKSIHIEEVQLNRLEEQFHRYNFTFVVDECEQTDTSHILKIDRSLFDNSKEENNSAVDINNIIEHAHENEMLVVCKRIETKEQLEYLQKIGCDIGQGFLISEPISIIDFEKKWLVKENHCL